MRPGSPRFASSSHRDHPWRLDCRYVCACCLFPLVVRYFRYAVAAVVVVVVVFLWVTMAVLHPVFLLYVTPVAYSICPGLCRGPGGRWSRHPDVRQYHTWSAGAARRAGCLGHGSRRGLHRLHLVGRGYREIQLCHLCLALRPSFCLFGLYPVVARYDVGNSLIQAYQQSILIEAVKMTVVKWGYIS